jgi:hypothetical protein
MWFRCRVGTALRTSGGKWEFLARAFAHPTGHSLLAK